MLKKIEKLIIRDVRKWKGEHTFEFQDGTNLIKGPNGSGKSTIWLCIALGLTHSAKSNTLKEDLSPNTGGSPVVTVNFQTTDGQCYSITKVFGDQGASILRNLADDQVIATGSEADDQARSLTFSMSPTNGGRYSRKNGVMKNASSVLSDSVGALAFPPQGQLNELPEIVEAIRRIGLEVDEAELSKALEKISLKSESEGKAYISARKKDGSPTSNASGKIVIEKNNLEQLTNSLQLSEAKAKELKIAQDELQNLTESNDEISEEEKTAKREEILTLRDEAKTHRTNREEAKTKLDESQATLLPLQLGLDKRNELENRISKLNSEIFAKEQELDGFKELFEQEKLTNDKIIEENNTIEKEQEKIQAWKDYQNADDQRSRDQKLLEDLTQSDKNRKTLEKEILVTEESLQNIKLPTDSQWRELRELENQEFALKAQQKMKVTVAGEIGNLSVKVDGEEIDQNCEAFHSVDIFENENKLISIAQELNEAEITEIELKRSEILAMLEAESMAELNKRQSEHSQLSGILTSKQEQLSQMRTSEQFTELIEGLEKSLAQNTSKPKGKRPSGDLDELMIRIEERLNFSKEKLDKSNEDLKAKNANVISTNSVLTKLREDMGKLSKDTSNHILEFGATDVLRKQFDDAKASFDNLNQIHTEFKENKKMLEETKEVMANKIQDMLDNQVDLWSEINRLEERIKLLRQDENLENLPDLRVKVKLARDHLKTLQLDHDAYQLISQAATKLMLEAQNKSRSAVNNEMQRKIRYVIADSDLRVGLDDDGMPSQIGRVPFRDESHGGREQISMIWRLILLNEETNGNGTVLALDDPLTNTDDIRMKRMKEVLTSYSNENMQILLFSCHGNDYVDIADNIIDVSGSAVE